MLESVVGGDVERVHAPLDDFTFGDAFANVGELERVEDFAGSEECVDGVEMGAEERATEESALDSNGHLHCRCEQDPIGRGSRYIIAGTESNISHGLNIRCYIL